MATSRVAAAIDALITALGAAAPTDVPVIDGYRITEAPLNKAIVVGWDGDQEGDYLSASDWSQTFTGIGVGQKRKDETFSIPGCAVSWAGEADDGAPKRRRDEVFALLAVVEDTLRADPGLGQPQPFAAHLASAQFFQEPDPSGDRARITFTVSIMFNRI